MSLAIIEGRNTKPRQAVLWLNVQDLTTELLPPVGLLWCSTTFFLDRLFELNIQAILLGSTSPSMEHLQGREQQTNSGHSGQSVLYWVFSQK